MRGMYHVTEHLIAKKADDEDVDFIIKICKTCLVDQRIWQGSHNRAKEWWRLSISSDLTEVWIFFHNNQKVGFCVLVKNLEKYRNLESNFKRSLYEKMLTFLMYPLTSVIKILRKLHKEFIIKHDQSFGENFLWIRSIAVMPQMQGKGIGKNILYFIGRRGTSFGLGSLKLGVAKKDKIAIRLYEKDGFVKTGETRYYFYYAKRL